MSECAALEAGGAKMWRKWSPPPPHDQLVFVVSQLRDRRQALGLSQLQLDARIGWALGQAGKYECFMRRPTVQALAEWAQALDGFVLFLPGKLSGAAAPGMASRVMTVDLSTER